MALIDISRTIEPQTAVWPGDTPFQLTQLLTLAAGDAITLTTLTISAHMGTHIDAPCHFAADTPDTAQLPLDIYWGLAQVITVDKTNGPLEPSDLAHIDLRRAPRLLVNSGHGRRDHTIFHHDFVYPSPALADHLGRHGLILYGTDAPSMDFPTNQTMSGHQALWRNRIYILEGLDLSHTPDGLYELVALPLKIAGGDGSPVRAILRTLDEPTHE